MIVLFMCSKISTAAHSARKMKKRKQI